MLFLLFFCFAFLCAFFFAPFLSLFSSFPIITKKEGEQKFSCEKFWLAVGI
ncbi:hypothetical protein HMPREF9087_0145 [Enterococcus casseliflavus ATCC 12755]|uniref:Uncharacterized protein n=1 Tax=Enterococcus casseliflavus ATCC 12755 TaxID=888066 RepID=F0EG48_ENTCA|nr:hypothetical protein HMPREF9087_0145 [Enterococcus casseliflavus ATCC 12755]